MHKTSPDKAGDEENSLVLVRFSSGANGVVFVSGDKQLSMTSGPSSSIITLQGVCEQLSPIDPSSPFITLMQQLSILPALCEEEEAPFFHAESALFSSAWEHNQYAGVVYCLQFVNLDFHGKTPPVPEGPRDWHRPVQADD